VRGDSGQLTKVSKFLSLILRHQPEVIGLRLDTGGWVAIAELVAKARAAGIPISEEIVRTIILHSNKQRFALSTDGKQIRANQGHSIPVDLGLPASEPPELLYHGTASRNLTAILNEGIKPGKRLFVHLSLDLATATAVGKRHGVPVILTIQSGRMHRDGFKFLLSMNGVWMTDHVPKEYLKLT
jgi:putative RNA 2'-phosphotransferase